MQVGIQRGDNRSCPTTFIRSWFMTTTELIHQHRSNGYIWHTTDSVKTPTLLKTFIPPKDNLGLDKCVATLNLRRMARTQKELAR